MIPAIILAAGAGRRMGGPKALLTIHGETLLNRMARVAESAGCHPVLAVIGDWDPGPLSGGIRLVRNPGAAEGMASSIRVGIAALSAEVPAALLLAVDQPGVDATLLRQLIDLGSENPDHPVASAYGDTLGIPAVLPRRLFLELMALQGDRGAKAILLRENAVSLPFPGGEFDLDSPEDLNRIRR